MRLALSFLRSLTLSYQSHPIPACPALFRPIFWPEHNLVAFLSRLTACIQIRPTGAVSTDLSSAWRFDLRHVRRHAPPHQSIGQRCHGQVHSFPWLDSRCNLADSCSLMSPLASLSLVWRLYSLFPALQTL